MGAAPRNWPLTSIMRRPRTAMSVPADARRSLNARSAARRMMNPLAHVTAPWAASFPGLRAGVMLILVLSGLVRATPVAAQQFHLCSQFSSDEGAAIVGQPIISTQEYAESAHWGCQHVAAHAETLLEIWQYSGAEEATSQLSGGAPIAGLGEASTLTKSDDGTFVLLRVLKLPYLITVGATFDEQPVDVATDTLVALAQRVLGTLPTAPEPDAAPAIGGRTPATIDPCSIVNEDDVRAALAAVSASGSADATGAAVRVTFSRVAWTEEPLSNPGASSEACKVVWGSNSTLVVLVTRQSFDLMALLGGKPDAELGGDRAIVVDEVPYVLKGDIAVLAETGGSGGTLRWHREIVKRAAARL